MLIVAVGSVAAVTLLAGWLSNRDIAGQSPLEVLRQET